ncbi:MAG: ABC transporter substrate-binding protein [Myxococcaceae bacterium]
MKRLALPVFAILLAATAFAASRARFGGIVRVAVIGSAPDADPTLSDTPNEAAVLSLSAQPICRIDRNGQVVPTLAASLSHSTPTQLRIALKPGLRFSGGQSINVHHVVDAWSKLLAPGTASPYRALFFPLRNGGTQLTGAITPPSLIELSLAFPWPDLEKSLCHPALTVTPPHSPAGLGPFLPATAPGVFIFNLNYPEGRPYPERVVLTNTDERGAAKAYSLDQAQVILGGAPTADARTGPALYGTWLVYQPSRVGNGFRGAFEAAVDRTDLVRFFVRSGPSVVMSQLLPPALMPQSSSQHPVFPNGAPPPSELTLLYDSGAEDQRAVAERIQVKLHDRGYRIALKGAPRSVLRSKWASGDFDFMLQGLLLPPAPAPAFAIALDLAGKRELLATELPTIGSIADQAARDNRTRDRADALLPTLPIIPLYAQGLAVTAKPEIENLAFDAQGLPTLGDTFLGAPAP